MEKEEFVKTIRKFYQTNRRDLPWRNTKEPYHIFISEIMLQQTQVSRVIQKYQEFLNIFPDFDSLARANQAEVLKAWQGMGYNRRALYLKKSAELIVKKFDSKVPKDPKILETFPGIGKATARSIAVFSYNLPLPFIETNIRRVIIHHFFEDSDNISDADILPIVEQTIDKNNSREWFYALMDYGSYLAKKIVNPNRKSKHYIKQTKFEGSVRQVRGKILKTLLSNKRISIEKLKKQIVDDRLEEVLKQLEKEQFIKINNKTVFLSD